MCHHHLKYTLYQRSYMEQTARHKSSVLLYLPGSSLSGVLNKGTEYICFLGGRSDRLTLKDYLAKLRRHHN